MNFLYILRITLFFIPMSVFSRTLQRIHSQQRLNVRAPRGPIPEIWRPDDVFIGEPMPHVGDPEGIIGLTPEVQGETRIDWARSLARMRLSFPGETLVESQEPEQAGSQAFGTVWLAWHADTNTVELLVRDTPDENFGFPRSLMYQRRGDDARNIQRLHIINRDNYESFRDYRNAILEGTAAMDSIIQGYTGPLADNSLIDTVDLVMSETPDYRTMSMAEVVWLADQLNRALAQMHQQQGPDPSQKRSTFSLPSYNSKRADPLKTIECQQNNGPTCNKNASITANYAAEFELYLQAFDILQSNISSLLFPVLAPLITDSKSTLVHLVAWSIWSDITISPSLVIGPFKNGLSSLTYIENQYLNRSHQNLSQILNPNGTIKNSELTSTINGTNISAYLAVHGALESLYYDTWNKAIEATNSTGMLVDLARLTSILQMGNLSIVPPDFYNISSSRETTLGYKIMRPTANATSNL